MKAAIDLVYAFRQRSNLYLYDIARGRGSQPDGSWKLISWCFLTESNEIYQLLFTSSKILILTKVIACGMLAFMCNSIVCANFNLDFPKMAIFKLQSHIEPTIFMGLF